MVVIVSSLLFLPLDTLKVEKVFDASGIEALIVAVANGDVNLTGWEKNEIKVVAYEIYPEGKASQKARMVMEKRGKEIVIKEEKPGVNNSGVNFFVYVPSLSSFSISTVNGDVECKGINGAVNISVTNGDVEFKEIEGSLSVSSTNGDVSGLVDERIDSLCVSTVNGDIYLRVKTENPWILVDNVSGEIISDFPYNGKERGSPKLVISTTNGDVKIEK
ncbi:hypothetical protein DRQ20_02620 [bacterium]|nr:MAG: hypothetical protein DRQ20_02620 [bacterium]